MITRITQLFLITLLIQARSIRSSCLGLGTHVRQRLTTTDTGTTCLNELWYVKRIKTDNWLSICADTFDVNAANIWCRDLGFSRVGAIGESVQLLRNSTTVKLSCTENARDITECNITTTESCFNVMHNTECEQCPNSDIECASSCSNGSACRENELNIFEYPILVGVPLALLSLTVCCIAWSILLLSLQCIKQCARTPKPKSKKTWPERNGSHCEEDYENNAGRRASVYRDMKDQQNSNSPAGNDRISEVHYGTPSPIKPDRREASYTHMSSPRTEGVVQVNMRASEGHKVGQGVGLWTQQQERMSRSSIPSYIELT